MSQYFNQSTPTPSSGGRPRAAVRGPQTVGLAVASLVLGIVSVPLFFCFGFVLAAVAIILGVISLVIIKKNPEGYKGAGMAWGGIITACLSLAIFAGFQLLVARVAENAGEPAPPTVFEKAEDNIRTQKGDQVGYGNTEAARALATEFANQMKEIREIGFTGESGGGLSLSGGEFLTHCELHDESCAFIVHVPSLRKFDDDAKVLLNDIGWNVAQGLLAETDFPEGGQLAVGLKGVLIYDDVRTGRHVKAWEEDDEAPGLEKKGLSETALKPFFPDPEPEPEPEPELGVGEAPAAASDTESGEETSTPTTTNP